ncbi:hypothetical protein LJ707_08045 [Mucilaginibacter sp. UR6-1]|uniref:hypothetical protein n=1 Tax=Mucilaginibacter sp. UR6-1 TaxID=1435643 RepID=UPI001E556078|nr:hypothetical protein [Mucilaginibacter sp. UR6-1]MCC8408878.1 hypothetical protein [Mucilaginibacter sp. UR6-1]
MATENDRYDDDLEEEYEDNEQQPEGEYIELYSKWSIWGFSIFFSSFFGAALLIRNLWVSGFKRAAFGIVAFAVAYSCASYAAIMLLQATSLVLVANLLGGFLYGEFFFKRYFPESDYYPKSIWGALGIALILSIAFVLLTFYLDPEAMKQLRAQ